MKVKSAHKPIRPKYNPKPNARELAFHHALMELPCMACHVEPCGVAHHLLTDTPEKRWRRDHEMMINLCDYCHRALHSDGDEMRWCEEAGFQPVETAVYNRAWGRRQGLI